MHCEDPFLPKFGHLRGDVFSGDGRRHLSSVTWIGHFMPTNIGGPEPQFIILKNTLNTNWILVDKNHISLHLFHIPTQLNFWSWSSGFSDGQVLRWRKSS